ncbi:unnamed protein product [Heligmosomoides polygyrus]|uniref:Apple domain-containing protein n=1 Tax=Heligmosomoides polygyrus TaxID=6339 RepID=A0A3P8BSP4_HELPZ|nr:unnamed protein product [Heligmosomoides polygyrus]
MCQAGRGCTSSMQQYPMLNGKRCPREVRRGVPGAGKRFRSTWDNAEFCMWPVVVRRRCDLCFLSFRSSDPRRLWCDEGNPSSGFRIEKRSTWLRQWNNLRCLCAATYSTLRLHRCQSLQWYRDGKCVLNKGSHLGKYDLIEDKLSTYQFIACDVQGIPTASWKFLTQVTTTVRPSTTTTTSPTSTTVITTEAVITTESTTTEETRATDATVTEESMKINNDCFEEISGYMMTNVAGGLEHDVSMEECKCFCASSRASRRYSFECLSATYYHEERDCILNLDDRHRNPQLLEKQNGQYAVTYLAMTNNHENDNSTPLNLSCPTLATYFFKFALANTDVCFLELSDFVLEGTALAIETAISHQECKCRCLNGETRYGEACQSFQYYFDSTTCLINKQNRFSNPENFNFVPNLQPRSYFEHRCATRGTVATQKQYFNLFQHRGCFCMQILSSPFLPPQKS